MLRKFTMLRQLNEVHCRDAEWGKRTCLAWGLSSLLPPLWLLPAVPVSPSAPTHLGGGATRPPLPGSQGAGCSCARPPLDGTFSPTQGRAAAAPARGDEGAPSRSRPGRCWEATRGAGRGLCTSAGRVSFSSKRRESRGFPQKLSSRAARVSRSSRPRPRLFESTQ